MSGIQSQNYKYSKILFYLILVVWEIGQVVALPKPRKHLYFDMNNPDFNLYLKTVLDDGFGCPIGIFTPPFRKKLGRRPTLDFCQDSVPILVFNTAFFPTRGDYSDETELKPPNWNRRSKAKSKLETSQTDPNPKAPKSSSDSGSRKNGRTTFSQTESCICIIIFALNNKRPRSTHKTFDYKTSILDLFNWDTHELTLHLWKSFPLQMIYVNFFVRNSKDFWVNEKGNPFTIFSDELGIEINLTGRNYRFFLTTVEHSKIEKAKAAGKNKNKKNNYHNAVLKRNLKIQNVYIFHSFRHTYEPILIRLNTAPFSASKSTSVATPKQNEIQSKSRSDFLLEIYQGLKNQILYLQGNGVIFYAPQLLQKEENFMNEEPLLPWNIGNRWRKDRLKIWENSVDKVIFRYVVRAIYPNLTAFSGDIHADTLKSKVSLSSLSNWPNDTFQDQADFINMSAFRRISFQPVFSQSADTYVIPLAQDSIGFFTCDRVREETTFWVFVQPFQKELWLATGTMWLILSLFLYILSMGKLSRGNKWGNFIKAVFLPYRALVENFGDFDQTQFKDFCQKAVGIPVISWLLIGVVITNGYRGVVTSDVTAPRPKIYHQKFNQLVLESFSLFGAVDQRKVADYYGKNMSEARSLYNQTLEDMQLEFDPLSIVTDDSGDAVAALTDPPNGFDLQFYPLAGQVHDFLAHGYLFEYREDKSHPLYPLGQIIQSVRAPSTFTNYSVEDEVSKCDRTAYFDLMSRIGNFRVPKWRRDTVKTRQFFLGAEQILRFLTGWELFDFEGLNGVPSLLQTSLESGIFKFYESAYKTYNFKGSLQFLNGSDASVVPLKLQSNFMEGVLRIYSVGIFAALVCLVASMLYFLLDEGILWIGF